MNRIVLISSVLLSVLFVSCKKDKTNSNIEKFIGEYTITTTYNVPINNIPLVGSYTYDRTTTEDGAIRRSTTDEEKLVITMGDLSTSGYVDKSGKLHVDPLTTQQSLSLGVFDVHVTFPTISAPVDGKMSWTSDVNLSATIVTYTVEGRGIANQVAVKKETAQE